MSRDSWDTDFGALHGVYRDRENGWVFGVCAGIAERFNFRLSTVRVIAVISLFLFFWPTAAAYLAATALIREKPLVYSGRSNENDFWRSYRRDHWRRS
ncbi:MAG: PspC domain-containing protein [Gammaproteobacteria bacterium]|nr:PspC domain-containing protein [Gammaproteobacteria bacterium]MBU2678492.1 PspC domain-containing protein [Gammaproteobacteria bacterium]NNC56908.1 PspC domain-containing protein [Woeseiaceae bacterium]NNL52227.1 PspC domain-containing protein [Woeseiaceae bacterium]